ncbi:MAG: DmsE family decaheme c-type cytochrome [Nitrosospira sp.]|nr:DmsE family decaheme c-type cytochrome [Nitrosospira sp.]
MSRLTKLLPLMAAWLQLIFLLPGLLVISQSASAQDDAAKTPIQDMVLKGDARCTRCHDEHEKYPVLSIGKTKHGTVADSRTPTCTSCHGESEVHVRNPEKHAFPERSFGKNSTNSAQEKNQACLACHEGGIRMHWAGSRHANQDVPCAACHQVHAAHDKVRDRLTQSEVCFACHKEQRIEIKRPYRHPIREGKVACSDCHNPHGSAGPSMMVRDSINDTCYTCHMEKRGPFVRNHQPVQENCAICHNPHGTTAPNLLRWRSPFLCQECHEPNTHQGAIGSFDAPGGREQNTLARGCLNCHTQIHGSNSPLDERNERLFQR